MSGSKSTYIRCDADGCEARIELERDVNQTESVEVAKQHGWSAYLGARAYHWCDRHTERST